MTDQQIDAMVRDACRVEKAAAEMPGSILTTPYVLDTCCHVKALADECARLRECISQIAQVRGICGSAQGHFRVTLRMVDAVLLGADLRNVEVVEAVAAGTWRV